MCLFQYLNKKKPILHIIIVYSNPCKYNNRYKLAVEFIENILKTPNTKLYIVETTYSHLNPSFDFSYSDKYEYLPLVTDCLLWHKENMINLGIKILFPDDWEYMAWIDADIEFENPNWVLNSINALQTYDIIQLFSHCDDLNNVGGITSCHTSFMYRYCKQDSLDFHSGYAWAMTRKTYEKIGGLFEYAIIGGADRCMALAFVGHIDKISYRLSPFLFNELKKYQDLCKDLKVSYLTSSVIRHHYHGNKKNRFYHDRYKWLLDANYNPHTMLLRKNNGLLTSNPDTFPLDLNKSIESYFFSRNEDH